MSEQYSDPADFSVTEKSFCTVPPKQYSLAIATLACGKLRNWMLIILIFRPCVNLSYSTVPLAGRKGIHCLRARKGGHRDNPDLLWNSAGWLALFFGMEGKDVKG